ncbi:hypothetical protein ASO20_01115 [Mycoplasma sp. (ex Biomphalaria glabrata)]|uniref:phosphoribosylaminoimidazolesuccinocarboxamide synthase n=1 Tax=Mycoplasma sp. (ex Biomphalaria glabrata) TaxID=1749074 RepID=UPI00073A951A|nr:phosphoribosylaminoimidazolesuccinocarboxamide synthase [Mycoplasma sp. (ex Biomphalaria glabrata)]ALV23258.1 hypothetical protein ASO20_01115 [Mycoplasma sp. (ex Biomphalaria glabrata)]
MELIYTGKAKKVYKYDENNVVIEHTNNVTAFNSLKKNQFNLKGILNCEITTILFQYLANKGIRTHFIKNLSEIEQLCKKVDIIPLEIIVRNQARGSIVKRLGVKKDFLFKKPIVEFSLKNDELGDPLISESQIIGLGIVTEKNLKQIQKIALSVNIALKNLFSKMDIMLVDFKIELGWYKNQIILADEITPDCMRLVDKKSLESLDKDLYREEKGDLVKGYQEFLERLKNVI